MLVQKYRSGPEVDLDIERELMIAEKIERTLMQEKQRELERRRDYNGIYSEDGVNDLIENDEISAEELGFIVGFIDEEE